MSSHEENKTDISPGHSRRLDFDPQSFVNVGYDAYFSPYQFIYLFTVVESKNHETILVLHVEQRLRFLFQCHTR